MLSWAAGKAFVDGWHAFVGSWHAFVGSWQAFVGGWLCFDGQLAVLLRAVVSAFVGSWQGFSGQLAVIHWSAGRLLFVAVFRVLGGFAC